ncbi:hypothetical protein GTU99_07440 [Streptomyces sp. PRKS01-65]|nr:FtsK/SpoIIIE domain-containing protein [Streptomyces harenosi]NEY32028.1 hypothetical protein [Streptomyces harenosi]
MILRLTVEDAGTSVREDVEVVAAPDSRVGPLLDSLPVAVGGRRCFVGGVELKRRATLAESPLIPGAVISVGAPGPVFRPVQGSAVGVLKVIAGPDTGLTVALGPGSHTVARNAAASICLRDLDVSRREHVRLEVSSDARVTVVHRGSTNGAFVDGREVLDRTGWEPGGILRIGSDELRWVPLSEGGPRAVRAADGRLDFDRPFASVPEVPIAKVTLPAQPASSRESGAMQVLAYLPGVGGILLGFVMQRPLFVLFGIFALVAAFIRDSIVDRQRQKEAKEFAAAQEATRQEMSSHAAQERRVRLLLAPGPAEISEAASGARPDLWPRRVNSSNGLVLRVGTADQQASVDLRGEPWEGFRVPVMRDVPVTVDLSVTGVLGVAGPRPSVDGMLGWLLIQLATLRGPDDLRLVVMMADGREALAWTRWLPHVDAGPAAAVPCLLGSTDATRTARVQELRRLVATRRADKAKSSATRFAEDVVVVLDGASALRNLPGMDEILHHGPAVGVYLVCADEYGVNECRGLCEMTDSALRLTRTPDAPSVPATPHLLDTAAAERLARALAPMRDRITLGSVLNAVPDHVRFLDLLGIGSPAAEDVQALWNQGHGPRTRVVLGADADGPVTVDLAEQGPHTMLGGATGAGKSILLQTLVTSLLLANRPDELNLVLVDFKGGSAFLPFERCPHVVALIRSTGDTPADVFDDTAAARVLASVRAEVSRRESLLARYDGEIDRYWSERLNHPDLQPLPRLVMVFDEFARVLETSPDFLKELVNVAAKGRSLGMHLVLATQSLQGKLSPELKNNISLRISLRQNEAADSAEVLGVPDAAALPGSLRGRGMIVCTTGETRVPQVFQSGYLGSPPPSGSAPPVSVRALRWTDFGAQRPAAPARRGGGPTDQDLAIAAVEEAARRSRLMAPFRPLLPSLPITVTLEDLARCQTTAPPSTAVPFGLADEPAQQAQPADFLDLAGLDRLMVAGGPQSGRTTFARTLITSLATRFRPDQAHVYVIEHRPAGLSEYASLPHCGGVFSPAEPDRIRRLITWLDQEVQRRSHSSPPPPSADHPSIVVVIDGWEYFEDHSDPSFTETSLLTTLRGIVVAGAPLGVHVVAIGGHDMLNHKLPAFYTRRLLLPFPKEETRRTHLTSRMTSPPLLPGRAVDAATGRHTHICLPVLFPIDPVSHPGHRDPARLPKRFPALPPRITIDELPEPRSLPSPTWIPLGIGGSDHTTIGIDLMAGPHLLLVSGPPGSGRTTTAGTLAHSLRRVGIDVLAIASPRSPLPGILPDDPGIRVLTGISHKDSDLRDVATSFSGGPFAVVIDDADHITILPTQQGFADAPTLLDDIAHLSARGHQALIITADATPVLTGFPSPLARLVNSIVATGSRILLTPSNRPTAIAHSLPLEPDQYVTGPPGRGYLATGQTLNLLQLAVAGHLSRPMPANRR